MHQFADFNLQPQLQQAIDDLGFKQPTPIQQKILQFTLKGHDAIGKAQTGTGKTAAFLISIINDLLQNPITDQRFQGEPRALILAPTRELAYQIQQDALNLTKHTDLKVSCFVGGVDYEEQRAYIKNGNMDILVATPGRLIDFVMQQEVWLDRLEFLVIDEADRLLDMGFIPDVKKIIRKAPPKTDRQTLLFSATFNYDVLNLASSWLLQPVMVEIEPEHKTSDRVAQRIYIVEASKKQKLLKQLLEEEKPSRCMIFANRRDQVKRLYEKLKADQYSVGMLSGEMPQDKRSRVLQQFKDGKVDILIATDVAGRGIHVDGISHVFNYTLPDQADDYVHRIGRTGRAGTTGVSISFACEDDAFQIPVLEKALAQKLTLIHAQVV